MSQTQKSIKKSHQSQVKNNELTPKTWKGADQQSKKEGLCTIHQERVPKTI
jgi:hypothetical protein